MLKQLRPVLRLAAVVLAYVFFPAFSEQRIYGVDTWTGGDVGTPAVKGSAQETACANTACPVFTLTGAGVGIGGSSDQFMYLYQKLTGDGAVTIRLQTLAGTATTEAGLMMRASLVGGAKHVSLLAINGGSGNSVRTRSTAGGGTASTAAPQGSWLRLERVGPTVTASVSSDGTQWTIAGTQTVTLPSTIYAGIALSSRVAGTLATTSVSNMSAVSTTPTLPSGWSSTDVGAAPSAGAASYANGSFIAASAGAGFAGSQDGFRFIYTRVRGDAKLVARVVDSEGRAGRQAAIVLRTTLDPDAAEASLVADDSGVVLVRRAGSGQAASRTRISTQAGPVFLKLDRVGSMMTASYSADGTKWITATSFGTALGAEVYAGLGVAAGPNGGMAAAAFDHLSLVAIAANVPPVVSLTSPHSGETYAGAVTMTATASDPDDLVARVDFKVNGVKVASDSAAPYGASWTAKSSGLYTVVAEAADFDGAVTASKPAAITVDSPGPRQLAFDVSIDHAKTDHYVMEIYNHTSHLLVLKKNIGKPAVTNGGCEVDVDSLITALPAGLYDVVVRAVASSETAASAPFTFAR